jgi:RNA polymerase sigma-70 factor (ECF subfamily)
MLLRDPVEADDATQATFVSAFKALLGGGAVREPAAWLATIARNECRGRSHARMREPLPLLDSDLGHAHGPHEEVNRRLAVEEIREAIAELPEKQREAVVLRDLYGLRYDEVGAALGLSRPAVEALLFRGRRRLRASLKPLASGALTVPLAVREGIAQALPGFGASAAGTGALAGGVTASAAGGGLIAKIAAAPVAAKLAAAAVAVGAAGSAGLVGAEQATHRGLSHPGARRLAPQADGPVAEASGAEAAGLGRIVAGPVSDEHGRSRGDGERASQAGKAGAGPGGSGKDGREHHGDDAIAPEAANVGERSAGTRERGSKSESPEEHEQSDVSGSAHPSGESHSDEKGKPHESETSPGAPSAQDAPATPLEQPETERDSEPGSSDSQPEDGHDGSGSSGGGDHAEDGPQEAESPA